VDAALAAYKWRDRPEEGWCWWWPPHYLSPTPKFVTAIEGRLFCADAWVDEHPEGTRWCPVVPAPEDDDE
jgi:hypothetical protein